MTALFMLLGASFGLLVARWIQRRSKRFSMLLLAVVGGYFSIGWAIGDPSARSIAMAVWCLALFSIILVPGMLQGMGPLNYAARRQKWLRLLLYFAVGVAFVGVAQLLLTTGYVVLWAVATTLLLMSILWIVVYGWRLSFYGRFSRDEHAGGGSALL